MPKLYTFERPAMTQVRNRDTESILEINENTSLSDMQEACPTFFRNKHGKRETFSTYRGCLIVRHTAEHSVGPPERKTVVYASYRYTNSLGLFCVSVGSRCDGVAQAKRLIDHLLDNGVYYYGFYQ